MIDRAKLTLIDGLGYALAEIKKVIKPEEYSAFIKWFGNKPHYLSSAGTKCILSADLQLYIRLRSNALKKKDKTK
jgi:hypothetical protein